MPLRWLLPQSRPDVVAFTVTPTASAKTVTLENFSAPYNCYVDWGDGQKSAQITGNSAVSHTYAGTTPRKISIRGILGGFWNAATISAGKTLVTSVDEVNSRSLVTLAHTFRGCTALATVPAMVDAPNVADFSYAFYQCRSITSALPALWLSHPSAAHTGCFTSCFKSLYGQHGTGCSSRQYVAAVAGQTYYQKYGTGCPAAGDLIANTTKFYDYYAPNGTTCPHHGVLYQWGVKNQNLCPYSEGHSTYYICTLNGINCSKKNCTKVVKANYCFSNKGVCTRAECRLSKVVSSYYLCSQSTTSGTSRCDSSCKRTYTSGQSAYYKCTKSNATCPTTNCPYPYANEADVNAAKAAGWA